MIRVIMTCDICDIVLFRTHYYKMVVQMPDVCVHLRSLHGIYDSDHTGSEEGTE